MSRHLEYWLNLTPESILEEIWYGSLGLHLIDAPIRCTNSHFKKLTPESTLEET
jgi:hypothetical protein